MPLHITKLYETKFTMTSLPGHCKFGSPENELQLSNSGKSIQPYLPILGHCYLPFTHRLAQRQYNNTRCIIFIGYKVV